MTDEEARARSAAAALMGKKGGAARAKALSKKQRKEIAQKAAETRWANAPKKKEPAK